MDSRAPSRPANETSPIPPSSARGKTVSSFEKPFVSAKVADTFGAHILSRDLRDFESSPHSQIVGTQETPSNAMHPRISW